MTPDLTNDKTRADYLEGEYRWMVAAVEKMAKRYPTVRELQNMTHLGRVALTAIEPEKRAVSDLVVKCTLLRDGNVTSLETHRRKRIQITEGPSDVA